MSVSQRPGQGSKRGKREMRTAGVGEGHEKTEVV